MAINGNYLLRRTKHSKIEVVAPKEEVLKITYTTQPK
jgi:hypothetical protein